MRAQPKKVGPVDPLDIAKAKVQKLLETSGDARAAVLQLSNNALASVLVGKLTNYYELAETEYPKYSDLVLQQCHEGSAYAAIDNRVDSAMEWYEKDDKPAMEGFQRTLLKNMKPKKSKKGKGGPRKDS